MQSNSSVLCDKLRCDLDVALGAFRDAEPDFPVCSHDGISILNPTATEFASCQLQSSIVKKFKDDIDEKAADAAAFKLFREMNDRCWLIGGNFGENFDLFDEVLGTFRQELWMFFNPEGFPLLNAFSIEEHVDFGPGSAPGAGNTSYLSKVGHSTLSAPNERLVKWYDAVIAENRLTFECEFARSVRYGNPVVQRSTEISPVPKTAKISRLVKPEPLIGMFFQKGIQRVLEERLRTFYGIDLTIQPIINGEMARLGSIDSSFATLDLKSASDCLSLGLCRRFIDAQNLMWLELTRSTHVVLKDEVSGEAAEGEEVYLHMMATMGNAFCFPLQTVIYAALVSAVYRYMGIQRDRGSFSWVFDYRQVSSENVRHRNFIKADHRIALIEPPNWSVFGDDIIVKREAYDCVVENLTKLGFIPNLDKSFNSGKFRESCGHDYFDGQSVRGVYCKSLRKPQDWYVLINTLTDWSVEHCVDLSNTIRWAMSNVKRIEVPPWENPDAGIRLPLAAVRTGAVYRTRPVKDECSNSYCGSYLYKRWCPSGEVELVERDSACTKLYTSVEISGEGRARHFGYPNGPAVMLSAIKGTLQGGCVSYRSFDAAYGKRTGIAPCWDYVRAGDKRKPFEERWFSVTRILFG